MRWHFEKFDRYNLVLLITTALLILIFNPVGGYLDQMMSLPWVDTSGYYLRENWFLVTIGHEFLKQIVIVVTLAHFILWLSLVYKKSHSPLRAMSGLVCLSVLITVSFIGVWKSQSVHACPWSLIEIQGTMIDWNKPLLSLGKCFPGGHASAGFSLIILYFAYRSHYPKFALCALIFALVLGTLMSSVQILRGAHFLSHNLWTFWWCWCIDFIIYQFRPRILKN